MPNPQLDIFLKLDGIAGESTVKGHEKEIVVLSYEHAVEVPVIHSAGGGGAIAGRAKFSGVRFRKDVDAASIPMLLACASGLHINKARFTFRRSVAGFEFYKVTLEDVLLTHIAQRAGTGTQYPLSFDALNAGASRTDSLKRQLSISHASSGNFARRTRTVRRAEQRPAVGMSRRTRRFEILRRRLQGQ